MTQGIKPQTIVKHTQTNRVGIVCTDLMNCCEPSETPVVYNENQGFKATKTSELEIIGDENAIPDPKKCGFGMGKDCCIFLTCGAEGFRCERFSELRYTLMFSNMTAKRHPVEMYPKCMSINNEMENEA